jgi:hypothetical protein
MTEETAVVEETVEETPQLSEEAQQFFKDRGIIKEDPVESPSGGVAPEAEDTAEEPEPEKEPKVSKAFSEVAKRRGNCFKKEQELKDQNEDLVSSEMHVTS